MHHIEHTHRTFYYFQYSLRISRAFQFVYSRVDQSRFDNTAKNHGGHVHVEQGPKLGREGQWPCEWNKGVEKRPWAEKSGQEAGENQAWLPVLVLVCFGVSLMHLQRDIPERPIEQSSTVEAADLRRACRVLELCVASRAAETKLDGSNAI